MNGARFRTDYAYGQGADASPGPIRTLAWETLPNNAWSAYIDDIRVLKGATIPGFVPPLPGWRITSTSSSSMTR